MAVSPGFTVAAMTAWPAVPPAVPDGVWLWRSGLRGVSGPCSTESLSAAHPSWDADVSRFGPFVGDARPGGLPGRWLRAMGGGDLPPVLVCGAAASSLDVARELRDRADPPAWTTILAVSQKKGRGQLRRAWHSPPGNLYAAVVLPDDWLTRGTLAPLTVSYCLARALCGLGVETWLKWPNDLLCDGRKVGGVLVEERGGTILAGIGLNLVSAPGPAALRPDSAAPAGFLRGLGFRGGPLWLWSELVKSVQRCYHTCVTASSPAECTAGIVDRLAWMGRDVMVREGEGRVGRARIAGLAEDGGLRLIRRDGGHDLSDVLYSGCISLL